MRRIMLLALLALALPTAALANIVYSAGGSPLGFKSGSITGDFSNPFMVEVTGNNGLTITLTTNTLTQPCSFEKFGTQCDFSSGFVTVENLGGTTLFGGGLEGPAAVDFSSAD